MENNSTIPNYYEGFEKDEIFRPVDCYNIKKGMYEVSNFGRVINIISGNELSQINRRGYRDVGVQNEDNSRYIVSIHRLVAIAFIPKTEEDIYLGRNTVNHKDLVKYHNFVDNLEWVTNLENTQHAFNNYAELKEKQAINGHLELPDPDNKWSRGQVTKGEANGMSRITEEQAHIICQSIILGKKYYQCAIDAGLEGTENDGFLVNMIARGTRWKYVSDNYNLPPIEPVNVYADFAHDVCKLLEKRLVAVEIIKLLPNLPGTLEQKRVFINNIRMGNTYAEISSQYNFPKGELMTKAEYYRPVLRNLVYNGYTNPEIVDLVPMPGTRSGNLQVLNKIRNSDMEPELLNVIKKHDKGELIQVLHIVERPSQTKRTRYNIV